jgi:hypothetical protein
VSLGTLASPSHPTRFRLPSPHSALGADHFSEPHSGLSRVRHQGTCAVKTRASPGLGHFGTPVCWLPLRT